MRKNETIALFIFGIIFAGVLSYLIWRNTINIAQAIEIVITFVLVCVTAFYAERTAEIANATKKQADASVKMTEEMREQRVMASRPVIIQKDVCETETKLATFGSKDWFSYFEVYNAGNGPAIEVEVSLLNNKKNLIHSQRKTFLRAGEPPIEFSPSELASLEKSTYYLVSEYQSIFSRGLQPTWYQTWLPFETIESSEKGKIYVKPGELEFREVHEKDRIDAFGTRSKPK